MTLNLKWNILNLKLILNLKVFKDVEWRRKDESKTKKKMNEESVAFYSAYRTYVPYSLLAFSRS